MAKTPNYSFEKRERERTKALKAAERLAAKQEQRPPNGDINGPAPADETPHKS